MDVLEFIVVEDDEILVDDEILCDDENDGKLLKELITESDDNGVCDTLYESLGELDIDSDELSEYDDVYIEDILDTNVCV
jgi:hypothetical protein